MVGGTEDGGRWRDRLSGVCLQLAACCFCSCFDLLVSAFVFAVIVIGFNTGLDKRKEQNACEICICFVHGN